MKDRMMGWVPSLPRHIMAGCPLSIALLKEVIYTVTVFLAQFFIP